MSYLLRVPFRQQYSPGSCWWAAASMMIEYFEERRPTFPWDFDPVFDSPIRTRPYGLVLRSYGGELQRENVPPRLWERMAEDSGLLGACNAAARHPRGLVLPHHWYRRGLPVDPVHIEIYCRLLGVNQNPTLRARQSATDPGVTAEKIENTLQRQGPFIVARSVLGRGVGQGVRGFHAVVVRGIQRAGDYTRVFYLDPETGQANTDVGTVANWFVPGLNGALVWGTNRSEPILDS